MYLIQNRQIAQVKSTTALQETMRVTSTCNSAMKQFQCLISSVLLSSSGTCACDRSDFPFSDTAGSLSGNLT